MRVLCGKSRGNGLCPRDQAVGFRRCRGFLSLLFVEQRIDIIVEYLQEFYQLGIDLPGRFQILVQMFEGGLQIFNIHGVRSAVVNGFF